MRKVLLFVFSVAFSLFSSSQTMFVGGQIDGDWGVQHEMNVETLGANDYFYFTIHATSDFIDAKFLFQADSYFNKWNDVTSDVNTVNTYTWHNNYGGTDNVIDSDVSNGKYYTFRLENNGYSNAKGVVMETSNEPRTISSVSYASSSLFSDGDPVNVTITINDTKSAEENFYVRYSTDAWTSSSLEEISFTGTTGTATIPAQNAETTVQFYVFSTTITNPSSDFYLVSLNYDNNNGANYEYTVNYGTAQSGNWSDISTWNSGSAPSAGKSIAINHDVTLNQDVIVSSLFINNGITFTANDNSKETRTLTIAADGYLNNSGTFDANLGIVEFAGDADISGTLSFYDVGISGVTDFGGGASVIHNATVRSGGYIYGDPPIYTEGSNLVFATGGQFRVNGSTTIWKDGSAVGAGFPDNVLITTTNPLLLEANRKVLGDLSISNGAGFQLSGAELQVKGDVTNEGDIYFFSSSSLPLAIEGNLTNSATGSITLSETSGGDLVVGGSFTDNGSFTHNDRSVFFSGGIPEQMIDGSSETTFGYIDVLTDAHVALDADKHINIEDDLRIAQSKGAGSFTIKSDASGSGSLIIDGNSANDVIIEKYIEGYSTDDGDGWHLLSIPVDQFTVSSSDFEPGSNDDLYYYDEPSDMWINWKSGTGSTNPGFFFIRGKGYLCAYQDEETKVFDGALNTSNVQVNDLTVLGNGNRTEAGWNMIGNPYPCSILWDDSWGSDIHSVAKVYPGTGNYVDVDPVNGIPSCQAFFVQVTAATSLSIPTTARLHSDEPWLKTDSSAIQTLKFKVTGGSNKFLDETRIRFKEDATEEFDRQYDAFKLFGFPNAPQLYTVLQNEPYSTNTFSAVQLDRIIDLNFIPGTSGQHQIELIENTCHEDCFVLLDDKFTNITSDITTNKTYTFDANTGDDPHRFQIRFSAVGVEEVQKENIQAYVSGNQLYILGEEGIADLRIYNLQAQELYSETIELTSDFSQSINFKSGIYIISLQSDHIAKTTKVIIP